MERWMHSEAEQATCNRASLYNEKILEAGMESGQIVRRNGALCCGSAGMIANSMDDFMRGDYEPEDEILCAG